MCLFHPPSLHQNFWKMNHLYSTSFQPFPRLLTPTSIRITQTMTTQAMILASLVILERERRDSYSPSRSVFLQLTPSIPPVWTWSVPTAVQPTVLQYILLRPALRGMKTQRGTLAMAFSCGVSLGLMMEQIDRIGNLRLLHLPLDRQAVLPTFN